MVLSVTRDTELAHQITNASAGVNICMLNCARSWSKVRVPEPFPWAPAIFTHMLHNKCRRESGHLEVHILFLLPWQIKMQATELPLAHSQWLLNRSNHFGDWPKANFVFITDLLFLWHFRKIWVTAFSPCLSKSPSSGAKFAAQGTVIYSELLLLISGLLPKLACCPSAGFLYICAHGWKIKGPASPGWSCLALQQFQPQPGLMPGCAEAVLTTWSRNGEHQW